MVIVYAADVETTVPDELVQFANSKLATGNAVSVTLSPTRYDPAPVATPPVAGVAKVVT